MATITINNKYPIEGECSSHRTIDLGDGIEKLIVQGILKCHEYIEDIETIEYGRVKLEGIVVFQEATGTEDPDILYSFNAKKKTILGDKL